MLKVIDIALAQVGYLEKASNSQLDSKTANAGNKNFTKYARDLDAIPGFYNGKKNGYAWCDVFVDWNFVQAYGVENAKKLLCQPDKSLGASCTYSVKYYKDAGRFHTSNPQVGDQIFFISGSGIGHTGLVVDVDSQKVYTVEGNTSGSSGVIDNGGGVWRKSYSLNYNKIAGYGRPDYSIVGETVGYIVYSVAKGDTLSKIATKYGTTYQALAEYNGIKNPNLLAIGQKIKIPEVSKPIEVPVENSKEGAKVVLNIKDSKTEDNNSEVTETVTVEIPANDGNAVDLNSILDQLTAIETAIANTKSEIISIMDKQ